MYILSHLLKRYKIKFVRNTDFPHSDSPVIKQIFLQYHLLCVEGLIKVYIIRLNKHENDRPHSIVSNNVGITI